MIPDINVPLNDVLMLTQSETDIMEAYRTGQYQVNQLDGYQVIPVVTQGISSVISTTVNQLTKAGSKFCDNVITYLTDSTKFVEKNRKLFESIPKEFIDFYIEGYEFSVLSCPRINFSELDSIVDGCEKFVRDVNVIMQSTPQMLSNLAIQNQLSNYMSDNNLANIRANMLGKSGVIHSEDFLLEVKKFYRSGRSEKETIHVVQPYVKKTIDSMGRIKVDIEQTRKEFEYMSTRCNQIMQSIRMSLCTLVNLQRDQLNKSMTESNTTNNSGNTSKFVTCISVMNAKYSQISTLRKMAEVILGERLIALRDQTTQSVELLNACLVDAKRKQMGDVLSADTPTLKSISGKPPELYTTPLTEATDYLEAALDQSILCESEYNFIMDSRYVQEMEFITSCLENQQIILMEAGALSKRYQSLKAAFIKFIDSIVEAVRKKIVAYNMRYIPWLNDIGEEAMQKKAQGMQSITMAPYYAGEDIAGDLRLITSELQKAAKPTNKDSLDFTRKFVNGIDTQEKYDAEKGNIPGYLKNYFRFHKKNAAEVKKEEVSGSDLAGKVSGMVKYIKNYEANAKSLKNLSKVVERAVSDMDATMESFNYLQLLECFAIESDLGLLEGYQVLLEEDTSKPTDNSNNEEKAGTVTNDKGEAESPTTVETSEQKEKKEAEEKGEKPAKSSKYVNTFQHFFQLVIGAYVTATEERFINYVNILSSLSGVRPTVDKNGKYIPQNKKDENKGKKPAQESVLPQRLYDKPSAMKGTSMYDL